MRSFQLVNSFSTAKLVLDSTGDAMKYVILTVWTEEIETVNQPYAVTCSVAKSNLVILILRCWMPYPSKTF